MTENLSACRDFDELWRIPAVSPDSQSNLQSVMEKRHRSEHIERVVDKYSLYLSFLLEDRPTLKALESSSSYIPSGSQTPDSEREEGLASPRLSAFRVSFPPEAEITCTCRLRQLLTLNHADVYTASESGVLTGHPVEPPRVRGIRWTVTEFVAREEDDHLRNSGVNRIAFPDMTPPRPSTVFLRLAVLIMQHNFGEKKNVVDPIRKAFGTFGNCSCGKLCNLPRLSRLSPGTTYVENSEPRGMKLSSSCIVRTSVVAVRKHALSNEHRLKMLQFIEDYWDHVSSDGKLSSFPSFTGGFTGRYSGVRRHDTLALLYFVHVWWRKRGFVAGASGIHGLQLTPGNLSSREDHLNEGLTM
ncbi:hypothetical protein Bbelb_324940 [Branchiostoma belcheri]|nr:hypothetical protein Bbelb_324940 [Branchiostoma belcheri]